jgi:hypothetical protein
MVLADALRVAVAACFLAGALLKWSAPTDLVAAAARLGVPTGWLAGRRGRVLRPVLIGYELVLALGLCLPATARLVAWLAAVTALGFAVLLALAVRRGEEGDCGCLGGAGGSIGWPVVVRNTALGVAAVAAALRPVEAPIAVVAASAVIAGQALALGLLARAYGRRSVPVEVPSQQQGFDPAWVWGLADGSRQPAGLVLNGRAGLLVFTDPGCAPCRTVLAHLRSHLPERKDRSLTLISRGDLVANQQLADDLDGVPVVIQADFEIARAMGVAGTPSAVQVTGSGARLGAPVSGAYAVNELVTRLFVPNTADRSGGHNSHHRR